MAKGYGQHCDNTVKKIRPAEEKLTHFLTLLLVVYKQVQSSTLVNIMGIQRYSQT